jgi:hypothetical protein
LDTVNPGNCGINNTTLQHNVNKKMIMAYKVDDLESGPNGDVLIW